ncbi:MAG: YhjD/YihY/BrkB family envelope integrity protein [Polyangiales bacterium]
MSTFSTRSIFVGAHPSIASRRAERITASADRASNRLTTSRRRPRLRPMGALSTPPAVAVMVDDVAATVTFDCAARAVSPPALRGGRAAMGQRVGSDEATYGALGVVVVLLLWMWVSTLALLLGTEINKNLMPSETCEEVATHVANTPETAKQQEADPEIEPAAIEAANARTSGAFKARTRGSSPS